jgi:hypothetical protein
VTSGTALIPGLGTLAALTFGVAADIGMTFKMQTELVLEIAAVHHHELSPDEKERVVLLVTGINAEANQAVTCAGAKISQKATERLAERSIAKAIPVIGVAASAGVNVLSTYIIGRRAHACFSLGEEQMQDWTESVRAITGVDEREISAWLSEATWRSWDLMSQGVQGAKAAVQNKGQAAGHVIVDAGSGLVGWSKWAGQTAWSARETIGDYLLWWRRDGRDEPHFVPDAEPLIEANTSPSGSRAGTSDCRYWFWRTSAGRGPKPTPKCATRRCTKSRHQSKPHARSPCPPLVEPREERSASHAAGR